MQRIKAEFRRQNIQAPDGVIAALLGETGGGVRTGTPEERAVNLWKNCDLRRFPQDVEETMCLSKIPKNRTTTISAQLCLQIDYLRDVSRPAYQQLQKVINRFGENVLVNGDAEAAPNKAMEYLPIASLSVATAPGTKVIGGQVHSLQDNYSQKKVLASILKADLEELEKLAPPCPPPNALPVGTPTVVPHPPGAANSGNHHQNGFDPDGDAFLADIPTDWGDDADDDAFLAGVAIDFDTIS